MDTNLSDDRVKLVRYHIVSIQRDQEKILHSGEEIFDDEMSDDAFATWMISRYGDAVGIGAHDRKYLRVGYEVIGRWAKQDRKYEKRQLEVLEGIREKIREAAEKKKGRSGDDRFARVAKVHGAQVDRLKKLREDFQRCGAGVSGIVADTFNKYREDGPVKAIELDREELAQAFAQGLPSSFDSAGLEAFPGRWKGTNHRYLFASGQEVEQDVATWHMTWEKGTEKGGEYVQRVIGSTERHLDSAGLETAGEGDADLALNVYREDIGVTGWLTTVIEARQELALVAYQFGERTFLWIGQVLSPDLEPVMGGNVFWMFLEWIVPGGKSPAYFMYGMMFEIDFDECAARPFGDSYRKARFDRVK